MLTQEIRATHLGAGIIADSEADNLPSRKVLEKNGFKLLDERTVASEPTKVSMAIYRLPPSSPGGHDL